MLKVSCAFFLLCFISPCLSADPWGKDADIAGKRVIRVDVKKCSTPLFGSAAEMLIQFHQDVISPADGPRSHFIPSSSQYTLEAMRKYGFYVGMMMGCDRLMRENNDPWVYRNIKDENGKKMKFDPVR